MNRMFAYRYRGRLCGGGMGDMTHPSGDSAVTSSAAASVETLDTDQPMAQLDLGDGPLILDVPDTATAYFVLHCVDAWTDNLAYIGTRTTGTRAGRYVLVPPGWPGELPAGATSVHCCTRLVSIVGRGACDRRDDVDRVRSLQEQIATGGAG